jgi:CubicO group peptidase (beta-lactamase class C family)
MSRKRLYSLVRPLVVVVAILSACGAQAQTETPDAIEEPATSAPTEADTITEDTEEPTVSAPNEAGTIEVVDPESVGMSADTLALIDEFAEVGINARYFTGVDVLVARHGQIAFFKAYGDADQEGTPMETDAVFRWASMTKPLVMVALMQQYDQGKFELDDPVSNFLPEYTDFQVAVDDGEGNITLVPANREITMHDLMSYTAGFTTTFYYGMNPVNSYVTKCYVYSGVQDLFEDDYTHTIEDNVMALPNCPLAYQPGEGWLYAHVSHDVIGYLVEQFSGKPLDEYMQEAIFEPLKMNETWFYPPESVFSRIPEATQPGNADSPFVEKALGILPEDADYTFGRNQTYLSGGAGLHGTIYDYFRFAQMMLNEGELDGVRIVSSEAVELMTHPTPDEFGVSLFTGNLWGYGVDVQVADAPDAPSTWLGGEGSYGWRGIWSTLWNNDPTDDTVILIMAQVGDDGAFPYMYLINDIANSAVIE